MVKEWVEHWLDPDDVLKEVEVDPDVFYDYFLSIPVVKNQRHFKEYKSQFLAKIKDGTPKEFATAVGFKDDDQLENYYVLWQEQHKAWEAARGELEAAKRAGKEEKKNYSFLQSVCGCGNEKDNVIAKCESKVRAIEKKLTEDIKSHFQKTPIFGVLDTLCIKFFWAILINVVVVFMIYAIMNTISSSGLPGRQRLPETTTFRAILKVDPTVVTNKDRFDRPETITDVCQGLGWWMEDPMFKLDKFSMPTGAALLDLTKSNWDGYLNPSYTCPLVVPGLANKLLGTENKRECSNVAPESSTWKGDDETMEFFLFQDQNAYLTGALARQDVYHQNGLTVTDTVTGLKKQFTFMAGNYNGKVQQLQPIEPFEAIYYTTTKPIPLYYNPFWVAQDRVWPSEWAVQALFTLGWNSEKAWDDSVLVGGFNDFGRRPTAIVEANLGGPIGPVRRNGNKIQEAIFQFLERRCWHTADKTNGRTPFTENKPASYSSMNQYDLKAEPKDKVITWDKLDQDLRDYWRALGLGIDTSKCPFVKTRVSTDTCIETAVGSNCKRVNYHSVQRWNAYNDDDIAEKNFNNRDFTNIFFEYHCDNETMTGKVLVKTPITGAPTLVPLTWDKLKLAEDGKLLEAATALGYDKEEWDRHRSSPMSLPPDNLVLSMENYLEGEAYFSTYFWTQVICSLIMVSVSMIEIRHIFLWTELAHLKDLFTEPRQFFSNPNKFFVLLTSGFIAFFQYIIVPVLLVMVSLLLILEAGSVTDMIKDTLSLLFLNEINNYLQIRNAPEAKKWTLMLKESKRHAITKAKSYFTVLMFIGFAFLGWGASEQVYSGLYGRYHPSLLFNTLRQRPVPEGNVAWALYVCTVAYVCVIFVMSWLAQAMLAFLERLDWDKGYTKWFYQNVYTPAQKFADAFNPLEDMDEDWFGATDPPPPPTPPPEPRDLEDPTLRGVWNNLSMYDGKLVDVLINPANNNVLATRTPGDLSGKVTWLDPTVKPIYAMLGTPSVMTPPLPGAYSSAPVATFPMAPVGAYPMSPPIVSSAMPPPGKSFMGAA